MTGRALVFTAPGAAEIRTVDVPEADGDAVLVETEMSGISQGTETWAFTGRRPETRWPTIPGYQGVGIARGGRVVFHKGRYPAGMPESWMGAHQSHAVAEAVTPVPDGVDPVEAALFALPCVALRGLRRTVVEPGATAVVLGQGLVGQFCAQALRARGAFVIASEGAPLRRRLSAAHSADLAVAPSELRDAVAARAPEGADVVVDTTGKVGLFPLWIDLIRPEGEIVMQGWYPEPAVFDFHEAHHKLATIRTPCSWEPAALGLEAIARGRFRVRPLVTAVVAPEEAPQIYARMARGDEDLLGVVVDWRR